MTIGICDDNSIFRDKIISLLNEYQKEYDLTFHIVEFSTGEELLDYKQEIALLFLDIEMPGRNGMEVAKELAASNPDLIIVFLTSHAEMMQAAFKVRAFRYLLKPLKLSDFRECLDAVRREISGSAIGLLQDNVQKIVKVKHIMYVEAGVKKTLVRTEGSTYESKNTMLEWEAILSDNSFYRCHKSYYVNLAYVDEICNEYIILLNNERVSISRRNKKEFQNKLLSYIKTNAR